MNKEWYRLAKNVAVDDVTIKQARDPKTSPKILAAVLRSHHSDYIAELVVDNPSTPPKVLSDMLLGYTSRPNNDKIIKMIAKSRRTPVDALRSILEQALNQHRNDPVVSEVILNPNSPSDLLGLILEKEGNGPNGVRAASNPNTDPNALADILAGSHSAERVGIEAAGNPNTPQESLRRIINVPAPAPPLAPVREVFYRALANPSAPPDLLSSLSLVRNRGRDSRAYEIVSENPGNPNISSVVLAGIMEGWRARIISSSYAKVAAKHPNTPMDSLLGVLREKSDDEVSNAIIQNPKVPFVEKYNWITKVKKPKEIKRDFPEVYFEIVRQRSQKTPTADITEDFIDLLKRIDIDKIKDRKFVEDFVYEGLNNPSLKDRILELPEALFNKIKMSPDHRKIVEEYFCPPIEGMEEIKELLGVKKNKMQKLSLLPIEDRGDWYQEVSDKIAPEIKGFFRFRIKDDNDELKEYFIDWQGLFSDVRITKHNMTEDQFKRFKKVIMSMAREESLKAYKEVMNAYVGGK